MSTRVLIVDDDALARAGLRFLLPPDDFTVVGEAATGAAAIAAARRHRPDVVLLDPELQNRSSDSVCEAILERAPETAVVLLLSEGDRSVLGRATEAGARGAVSKTGENVDLVGVIRRVLAGEQVLDAPAASSSGHRRSRATEPRKLSERERDVLELAAEGLTNSEIGVRLSLSKDTVKEYLSNAMRKLGVSNRVRAVEEARLHGLIAEREADPAGAAAVGPPEIGAPSGQVELLETRFSLHPEDPDVYVTPIKLTTKRTV